MSRLQQMMRARRVRLGVGLLMAAGGVWAFAPYVANDVATQAAVNAPLVRVSAPADGTVGALPGVGTTLAAPTRLKLVEVALDSGALGQAVAEAARAEAAAALARAQVAEIRAEEARLGGRARLFRTAAEAQLAADVTAARAEARSCGATVAEADAALARAVRLNATGFVSAAGLEKARASAEAARAGCDAARARAVAAGVEAGAARRGVLLADGANDQPYSVQQLDRLAQERRQLEARLLEAETVAGAEQARVAEARARAEQLLPAGMTVWSVLASPGTAVTAGAPLMELADCRRRFVELALPERRAAAVRPGDPAEIRLVGTSAWMTGRVSRVTGSAARGEEGLRAAHPQARPDAQEISVEVVLPAGEMARGVGRGCEIGRLAEVRLSRRLR